MCATEKQQQNFQFVYFFGLCSVSPHHFCPVGAKIVTRIALFTNYSPQKNKKLKKAQFESKQHKRIK